MKRENEGKSDGHHRAKLREAVTAGKAVKGGLKSERRYALVSTQNPYPLGRGDSRSAKVSLVGRALAWGF